MTNPKRIKWDNIALTLLVIAAIACFFSILGQIYIISHPTERYLITGEKDGEKVERVVDLHRVYKKQSTTAPMLKETDGYGKSYHHIYYTHAEYDDTIYGFDTICNIRKL